jgi:hypothetical protein
MIVCGQLLNLRERVKELFAANMQTCTSTYAADSSVFASGVNRGQLLCARRFLLFVAGFMRGGLWLRLPVRSSNETSIALKKGLRFAGGYLGQKPCW